MFSQSNLNYIAALSQFLSFLRILESPPRWAPLARRASAAAGREEAGEAQWYPAGQHAGPTAPPTMPTSWDNFRLTRIRFATHGSVFRRPNASTAIRTFDVVVAKSRGDRAAFLAPAAPMRSWPRAPRLGICAMDAESPSLKVLVGTVTPTPCT